MFSLFSFQRTGRTHCVRLGYNTPGGDEGSRTLDPLLARQVLSQLSYTPVSLVGRSGLEPPTSRLSGVRSNHLS